MVAHNGRTIVTIHTGIAEMETAVNLQQKELDVAQSYRNERMNPLYMDGRKNE